MTDITYNTVSQTETVDAQEDIENNSKKVIFRNKLGLSCAKLGTAKVSC